MRDVKKTAETGRKILQKRNSLDLSYSELTQFYEIFDQNTREGKGTYDALFKVIGEAYKMGLAVGMRNA